VLRPQLHHGRRCRQLGGEPCEGVVADGEEPRQLPRRPLVDLERGVRREGRRRPVDLRRRGGLDAGEVRRLPQRRQGCPYEVLLAAAGGLDDQVVAVDPDTLLSSSLEREPGRGEPARGGSQADATGGAVERRGEHLLGDGVQGLAGRDQIEHG
jgi:hypothetical protein